MGKLRDIAEKIVKGGPEHQARKQEEKRLKLQLRQERDQAYFEGRRKGEVAGAKAKGFKEGKERAMGGGGLLGTIGKVSKGADALGNSLGLTMDFGDIGKGLAFDGFGTTKRPKRTSRKTHRKTKRSKRRR